MLGIEMVEIKDLDKSENFLKEIASDSEIEYVKKSSNESLRNQRLGALLCIKKRFLKHLIWVRIMITMKSTYRMTCMVSRLSHCMAKHLKGIIKIFQAKRLRYPCRIHKT